MSIYREAPAPLSKQPAKQAAEEFAAIQAAHEFSSKVETIEHLNTWLETVLQQYRRNPVGDCVSIPVSGRRRVWVRVWAARHGFACFFSEGCVYLYWGRFRYLHAFWAFVSKVLLSKSVRTAIKWAVVVSLLLAVCRGAVWFFKTFPPSY